MKVFISYAREDQAVAQRVAAHLRAGGHECFIDLDRLTPGDAYNSRIREALRTADKLVFLASEHSITADSYALMELRFAQARWPNPVRHVLPVIVDDLDPERLPPYLHPLHALRRVANLEAEILNRIEELAAADGLWDDPTVRFEQWAAVAQRPDRVVRAPWLQKAGCGIFCTAPVAFYTYLAFSEHQSREELFMSTILALVVLYFGGSVFRRLAFPLSPQPVLIHEIREKVVNGETIHTVLIQNRSGQRKALTVDESLAATLLVHDRGWAYLFANRLVHFVSYAERDNA